MKLLTGRQLERYYPYVGGLFFGVLCHWLLQGQPAPSTINDLLSAAINISAITIGFLATAKSILLSVGKDRAVLMMKQAHFYNEFIDYIWKAVQWSFLLAVVSCAGLLVDFGKPKPWHAWGLTAGAYVFATMGFCCHRVINIFAKVLHEPEK